mmetsp:Transcript_920/g.2006  ORF Transcript_920/g.2006 Transcript_920/m.2006 type:complete len:204 (+) Transcript_920:1646-2257(+)
MCWLAIRSLLTTLRLRGLHSTAPCWRCCTDSLRGGFKGLGSVMDDRRSGIIDGLRCGIAGLRSGTDGLRGGSAALPQIRAELGDKETLVLGLDTARPHRPQHRNSLFCPHCGGAVPAHAVGKAVLDQPARDDGAGPALAPAAVHQEPTAACRLRLHGLHQAMGLVESGRLGVGHGAEKVRAGRVPVRSEPRRVKRLLLRQRDD